FSCALAELLRGWGKNSFPRNDSDLDALWFRRQAHEFDAIAEHVTERVRRERYSRAGTDRRINSGPAVVLLHDARFVSHSRKNRSDVFFIARILLRCESYERFARRVT